MKAFWTYTGLRLGLFVVVYLVLGLAYTLVQGQRPDQDTFFVLVVAAAVISSLLSLRLLRAPRERFARSVNDRAARATARFEEMRAKEDGPDEPEAPVGRERS